jgi:heat shock protein HslJ
MIPNEQQTLWSWQYVCLSVKGRNEWVEKNKQINKERINGEERKKAIQIFLSIQTKGAISGAIDIKNVNEIKIKGDVG